MVVRFFTLSAGMAAVDLRNVQKITHRSGRQSERCCGSR
jgi:hypothetical protein